MQKTENLKVKLKAISLCKTLSVADSVSGLTHKEQNAMNFSMCSVLFVQNIYYINDVGLLGGREMTNGKLVLCVTVASLPAYLSMSYICVCDDAGVETY